MLIGSSLCDALRLDLAASRIVDAGGKALAATLVSASLLASPPALAVPPTLNEAIVETSEASYPILQALDETFPPFAASVGKVLLDIEPAKIGPSIQLGIEAFNSVPAETVTTFTGCVPIPEQKHATAHSALFACARQGGQGGIFWAED